MTCPVCSRPGPTDPDVFYCPFCGALLSEPSVATLWVLDRNSNLFNRRFMQAALDQEYARSQRYDRPLSFLLVQLHDVPLAHIQDIIHNVRQALGGLVREIDTLGHWGPARALFAVILPETAPQGAAVLASRLATIPTRVGRLDCGFSGVVGALATSQDLYALATQDMNARSR